MTSVRGEVPLNITGTIFSELGCESNHYEDLFANKVRKHYRWLCNAAACEPLFDETDDSRLKDAYVMFRRDKGVAEQEDWGKNNDPDCFELSGILAYWLGRFTPVIDLREKNAGYSRDDKLYDALKMYPSEFLAFNFGLTICHSLISEEETPALPSSDYISYTQTVCYMMRFKSISPHALGLIYRSLFTDSKSYTTQQAQ